MVDSDLRPEDTARSTYQVAKVTDDDAIAQQTLAEQSLKTGNQWTFREEFELNTTGDTVEIVINNPLENSDLRVVARSFEPDLSINGTVWVNSEITDIGTSFNFLNLKVRNPELTDFGFDVAYNGTYEDRDEADGLTIRPPRGQNEPGQKQPVVRTGSTAMFRISPGANVHYEIETEEDNNTVLVEFILSERPDIDIELNGS